MPQPPRPARKGDRITAARQNAVEEANRSNTPAPPQGEYSARGYFGNLSLPPRGVDVSGGLSVRISTSLAARSGSYPSMTYHSAMADVIKVEVSGDNLTTTSADRQIRVYNALNVATIAGGIYLVDRRHGRWFITSGDC